MSVRPGHAYIELIVTLALAAIVATALSSVLLTHLRLARVVTARVAAGDASRLILHVLPEELRLADPTVDLHGTGRDSVALRLPRVSGSICARERGTLWLRARGLREPDATKDSVLVVSAGADRVAALTGAAPDPGACEAASGETIYRLESSPALEADGAAVLFESGSYYLKDHALRYRLGAEGRQPVTEELLSNQGSSMVLRSDSTYASFTIRLAFTPVFGSGLLAPVTATFPFPNAPAWR